MTSSATSARQPPSEANRSRSTRTSAGGKTGTGVLQERQDVRKSWLHLLSIGAPRRAFPQGRLADKSIEAADSSSLNSNGLRSRIALPPSDLHLRRDSRIRERRHDDHRRREPGRARRAYRLEPAHPRHADIRDDQIEWPRGRQLLDEVGAAGRADDVGVQLRKASETASRSWGSSSATRTRARNSIR